MSRTLTRIILALAVLGATPVAYVLVYIWADDWYRISDTTALIITDVLTASAFSIAWVLVWRSNVRWTSARIMGTALIWFLAFAPALGAFLLTIAESPYSEEEGCVLAGLSWWAAWIAGTSMLWRESERERIERTVGSHAPLLACPTCGYNMTGLHKARCPECGTQYTLNQIVASAIDTEPLSGRRTSER